MQPTNWKINSMFRVDLHAYSHNSIYQKEKASCITKGLARVAFPLIYYFWARILR